MEQRWAGEIPPLFIERMSIFDPCKAISTECSHVERAVLH